MTQTVPLNDLPDIIETTGDYVTRDGRRVTIHEIKPGTPGTTSFSAKGSVWRMSRGKDRPGGLDIWHLSGRNQAQRESTRDIVGPFVSA
jgi:hypothetical protein